MFSKKLVFPSPFGVICSLIYIYKSTSDLNRLEFPSPFGVICSLIIEAFEVYLLCDLVSVSFRSYLFFNRSFIILIDVISKSFPSPFGVICSLIRKGEIIMKKFILRFPSPFGVICSLMKQYAGTGYDRKCFRLLSELSVL